MSSSPVITVIIKCGSQEEKNESSYISTWEIENEALP